MVGALHTGTLLGAYALIQSKTKCVLTCKMLLVKTHSDVCLITHQYSIVSVARSLTCRDDLDSKWRLLLAENPNYQLHQRVAIISAYLWLKNVCLQCIYTAVHKHCHCTSTNT